MAPGRQAVLLMGFRRTEGQRPQKITQRPGTVGAHVIETPLPLAALVKQARQSQNPQVFGDGRPLLRKPRGDVAGRERPSSEQAEDRAPRRIGQRLKHIRLTMFRHRYVASSEPTRAELESFTSITLERESVLVPMSPASGP